MTRSPLFYPLNRGMDADAGGAADLQTDVMRFMAIISLCLVAIFALVQSIPLTPVATPTAPVETSALPEEPRPDTVIDEPFPTPPVEKMVVTRPEPRRIETREEPPVLQRPVPKPVHRKSLSDVQQRPEPTPISVSPASREPGNEQRGFTLRFESDDALTRLVARNVVSLYAIGQEKVQRMNIDSGSISFWAASPPGKIHEMDVATVPTSVLAAWRRSNGAELAEIEWGVTIPQSMSRQLNRYLTEQSGGSLVISASGALRLEQ